MWNSEVRPTLGSAPFSVVSISHCCAYGIWLQASFFPSTPLLNHLLSWWNLKFLLTFPYPFIEHNLPHKVSLIGLDRLISIFFLSSKQLSTMFTFIYNSENLDIPHTSANPHCPTLKGALDAGFFHPCERVNVSVSPPMSPCRENES